MIAKIQLKLNNDVLLTVIKMVKHTDDYAVENVTDALLISIKEDLIYKLEDKAKTIQKQVSILDHNKKHSLVLKYHEAYSMCKLIEAVHEKELFSEDLHLKKIKRLITELNNKLDIFAKEESITIADEDLHEEVRTEERPEKILVLEGIEDTTVVDPQQIEIPILFDLTEAFDSPSKDDKQEQITEDVVLALSTPIEEHPIALRNEDTPQQTVFDVEHDDDSSSKEETFPTEETIYSAKEDLFSNSMPESQPKLDWERITTEDPIINSEKYTADDQATFGNAKYDELFSIAKKGINVDQLDLIPTPMLTSEDDSDNITVEDTPNTREIMQIEIFDLETIEAEPLEPKAKKEKKKEKKVAKVEEDGQISLF